MKLYAAPNMPKHDQLDVHAELPTRHAQGLLAAYPCAVAGVSLTDYSLTLEQKGWGPHCTGPFTTITLSNGVRLTVDSRIAELVTLIMNANLRDGYVYRQADTGAYNCRYISGTTIWSNHAWGLAVDGNWSTNPQHSPLITDQPVWLRQRWNRYGFAWGGDYTAPTIPDAMHDEFMGTPAQAAAATALARTELSGPAVMDPAIRAHYDDPALDLHTSLGVPTMGSAWCSDGIGRYTLFANNGAILWKPDLGAWAVQGAIYTAYGALGHQNSALGYPVSDENPAPDGVGRVSLFQHGSIYWSAATGTQVTVTAPPPPPPPAPTGPVKKTSPLTGNAEIPGFDCSYTKPSAAAMAGGGFEFVMGYVSPNSAKNLTVGQLSTYRAAGLAVGLVWESSTIGRPLQGSGAGTADGKAAEAQANALGYPLTAPIFFAVDQDTTSVNYPAIQAYASAFNMNTRRPVGIYGEADVIDHFVTPGVQPVQYGWQTAAWSHLRLSAKAAIYQRTGHPGWGVPAGVSSTAFDEDVLLLNVPLMGWA